MKVLIEIDLSIDEDVEKYNHIINCSNYYCALNETYTKIRNIEKYGRIDDKPLGLTSDEFYSILDDNKICI